MLARYAHLGYERTADPKLGKIEREKERRIKERRWKGRD